MKALKLALIFFCINLLVLICLRAVFRLPEVFFPLLLIIPAIFTVISYLVTVFLLFAMEKPGEKIPLKVQVITCFIFTILGFYSSYPSARSQQEVNEWVNGETPKEEVKAYNILKQLLVSTKSFEIHGSNTMQLDTTINNKKTTFYFVEFYYKKQDKDIFYHSKFLTTNDSAYVLYFDRTQTDSIGNYITDEKELTQSLLQEITHSLPDSVKPMMKKVEQDILKEK